MLTALFLFLSVWGFHRLDADSFDTVLDKSFVQPFSTQVQWKSKNAISVRDLLLLHLPVNLHNGKACLIRTNHAGRNELIWINLKGVLASIGHPDNFLLKSGDSVRVTGELHTAYLDPIERLRMLFPVNLSAWFNK
jgi:hypothetical protein